MLPALKPLMKISLSEWKKRLKAETVAKEATLTSKYKVSEPVTEKCVKGLSDGQQIDKK